MILRKHIEREDFAAAGEGCIAGRTVSHEADGPLAILGDEDMVRPFAGDPPARFFRHAAHVCGVNELCIGLMPRLEVNIALPVDFGLGFHGFNRIIAHRMVSP